jgi:hypothetical protein
MRHLIVVVAACLLCPVAFAQPDGDDGGLAPPPRRTTTDTFDRPAGATANDWPWEASVSLGAAWFGELATSNSPGLAAQLRVAKNISDEAYVSANYLFALAEAETDTPNGQQDHDVHIATIGIGLRADVTNELAFFAEPRIGAIFGDVEAGVAAGLAAGLELEVTEGILLRFEALGMGLDSSIDTGSGNSDLELVLAFTMGVVFEF